MPSDQIVQRIAMKATIIDDKGRVLLLRIADTDKAGPNAGKYGLPGGKLKAGEQWDEGLVREVFEETGLKIKIVKPLRVGEWRPKVKDVQLQIIGVFFHCLSDHYAVTLSEENDAFQWVDSKTIKNFDVLEPDKSVAKSCLDLTTA